jgi:hypothetical protein
MNNLSNLTPEEKRVKKVLENSLNVMERAWIDSQIQSRKLKVPIKVPKLRFNIEDVDFLIEEFEVYPIHEGYNSLLEKNLNESFDMFEEFIKNKKPEEINKITDKLMSYINMKTKQI